MRKTNSDKNLSNSGVNFAQSVNAVKNLADLYGQFEQPDSQQPQQQKNTTQTRTQLLNSPQPQRAGQKPPASKQNVPAQNKQSSFVPNKANPQPRQRSNTPQKNSKALSQEKTRSDSNQKQQQQFARKQVEEQKDQSQGGFQQSYGQRGIIHSSYPIKQVGTNEKQILSFLKGFSENILMNSFFEEYYQKGIVQNASFFDALINAQAVQNKNDFVVLNYSLEFKEKPSELQYNGLFVDQTFICNDEALSWNAKESQDFYQWLRPSQVVNKPISIFKSVLPENVYQGSLGDCYLISSISVLADYPQLLRRLIEDHGNGKYVVWLCIDGRWKGITIDDKFPTTGGRFTCAPSYQGDIGVMLIEKAYAKQYGRNYKKIEFGFSLDAIKDLTGAPAQYIDLQDSTNAFKLIQDSLEKGFVLTVSSKTSGQDDGVISKHCYGILSIREIIQPGNHPKTFRLIKLRNPYGNINHIDQALPNYVLDKLGEPLVQNGGMFWMGLDDFVKDFEVVTVCKLNQNYIYSYMKLKKHNFIFGSQTGLVYLNVLRKTHLYLGIHQKHQRYFKKNAKDKDSYKYQVGRILLAKLSEQQKGELQIESFIDGAFSSYQSTFLEAYLEKGKYLVFTQFDGNQIMEQKVINYKKISSYTLSCYSENPIALEHVQDVKLSSNNIGYTTIADAILFESMYLYISQNAEKKGEEWRKHLSKSQGDGMITRYHGTGFGYVFIYHINDCANNKYIDKLQFLNLQNLYFYKDGSQQQANFDGQNWLIELSPNTQNLILFRIGNADNCSHKLSFSSKSNFESEMCWEDLKVQAIRDSQPKKRQRAGKDINVLFYQCKYNGGVMLVYHNQTKEVYSEQLTFTKLENLHPFDSRGDPYQSNTISIQVNPGEKFGVKLQVKNKSNTAFKYQISFI